MRKFYTGLISILLFISASLAQELTKIELCLNETAYLTKDKCNFAYDKISTTANDVSTAIKMFVHTGKEIKQMLYRQKKPTPIQHFSAWAGLYANQQYLRTANPPDSSSAVYMLALMYLGQFDKAANVGLTIVRKNPDDYAANLLLGLLSIAKQEYFCYLQKAFILAPEHTMTFWDWHFRQFRITPQKQWDFVDKFFRMLAQYQNLWSACQLHPTVIKRMQSAFIAKYGNYLAKNQQYKIPVELHSLPDKFVYPAAHVAKYNKKSLEKISDNSNYKIYCETIKRFIQPHGKILESDFSIQSNRFLKKEALNYVNKYYDAADSLNEENKNILLWSLFFANRSTNIQIYDSSGYAVILLSSLLNLRKHSSLKYLIAAFNEAPEHTLNIFALSQCLLPHKAAEVKLSAEKLIELMISASGNLNYDFICVNTAMILRNCIFDQYGKRLPEKVQKLEEKLRLKILKYHKDKYYR